MTEKGRWTPRETFPLAWERVGGRILVHGVRVSDEDGDAVLLRPMADLDDLLDRPPYGPPRVLGKAVTVGLLLTAAVALVVAAVALALAGLIASTGFAQLWDG